MKKIILALLLTLCIILLVYLPSIYRGWQFFDERLFYNEGLFPIPHSFTELLEIIKTYAFNYHIDSQNAFFSNIITVRASTTGAILNIIVSYLFKSNPIYYHILQISLHLINGALVWLIFYKLLSSKKQNYIFPSLITLVWALHPTNIEAVLLVTNWPSLLTYSFCFGFFLHTITKLLNDNFKSHGSEFTVIFLLFLLSASISEYSYALPIVLFFTSLAFTKSFINSLKLCLPYFLGLLCFVLIYLFNPFSVFISSISHANMLISYIERILWLAPQIFLHFLKLLFYPKDLSIYQTNLTTLADSYFHIYAIFALFVFLFILLAPILFFICKQKNSSTFLIVYCFVFSLFPFLHIVSPTYCIIAERYCYFPVFALLFFIVVLASKLLEQKNPKKLFGVILLSALVALTIRTTVRMKDWKDSFSLYHSATNCSQNNLYKGQIYSVLGYYFNSTNKKDKATEYINLSIKYLKEALQELKAKHTTKTPNILKVYGLDTNSLITTCAFSIAESKFIYLKEKPKDILGFYEPYIKNNLSYSGCSLLDLYAKLLNKTNQEERALSVLEFAREKYPFSSLITYTLSNLYLKNKDVSKAEEVITKGYKYYPSYKRMLLRMIKLNELKEDLAELAKYEYLLGLRVHSKEAYQRAVQLYLSLKRTTEAKVILDKLLAIDKENPVTYLLLSKYYFLGGNNEETLNTLNKAYLSLKNPSINISSEIYKSIIFSLISFSSSYGYSSEAKKYIMEAEQFLALSSAEKIYIEELKKKLQ